MLKNAYVWLSSRDSVEEKERGGERRRVAHQVTWSRKRTTSAVWQYFGFRPNEKGEAVNTDEAICKLCNKKVTARDENTSNLRSHIRNHHPLTAARMDPSSLSATVSTPPDAGPTTSRSTASTQPTIMGAFGKTTKYKRDSVRWKTCTDAVTKYLAKEMVSFHTVELISTVDLFTLHFTTDPTFHY